MTEKVKVTVVGSGYVGMSLAVLLAQHNDVTVLDIDPDRVDQVNRRESTVADPDIEAFLKERELSLYATLDADEAYSGAEFVVVATPTNYDTETNQFDTSSVDAVVSEALALAVDALVVIKSTVPVGHTRGLQVVCGTEKIVFSPEFLREGQALRDNLYPSRIIIGCSKKLGAGFAKLLLNAADQADVETLFMPSTEAEAVKLFANTYLAMRVSFFNEMDTYALEYNLNTESIIKGVCLDARVGAGYNNPSFGYGGYCLPKDTKQLLANFNGVPQSLIQAIVNSNELRKDFIADKIAEKSPRCVGFYRLVMKRGSDNFRESAVHGLIDRIKKKGMDVVIYEPSLDEMSYFGSRVIKDLAEFKFTSHTIVANRVSSELADVQSKVFSRDIFEDN